MNFLIYEENFGARITNGWWRIAQGGLVDLRLEDLKEYTP
jgi:hypothetical protein